MNYLLLTVTLKEPGQLFSAPVGQITGIGYGRYSNTGRILLASGGHVDTLETYEELVTMYEELTDVPQ